MLRAKILVFQHVPYEPLGTLEPLFKESGQWIDRFELAPRRRTLPSRFCSLLLRLRIRATPAVLPASTRFAHAGPARDRPSSGANRTRGKQS